MEGVLSFGPCFVIRLHGRYGDYGEAPRTAEKEFRSYAKKQLRPTITPRTSAIRGVLTRRRAWDSSPWEGLIRRKGFFKGERGGDILTFIIRKGSGGYIMIVEVESGRDAGDILEDFMEAYGRKRAGAKADTSTGNPSQGTGRANFQGHSRE